ncbi:MAG: hypothetical protein RLZZ136_36 [Pseudomonadota bacterium]|jgi:uncharacterized SAM-binding protein YcdF (DUF218 family)
MALAVLAYGFGFLWFVFAMPQPAGDGQSDAIVVLTGGEMRITRALDSLNAKRAPRLFVAGVDPKVRPREFAAQYHVSKTMMACCITLDFKSTDTITNAREAAGWIKAKGYKSIRLVTSDWHMRRAVLELARVAPPGLSIMRDAVRTRPSFSILVLEYNKLLARLAHWGRT